MIRNRSLFGQSARHAFGALVLLGIMAAAATSFAQSADNVTAGEEVEAGTPAENPYAGMNAGQVRLDEDGDETGKKEPESPFAPGAGAMVQMLLWLGLIVVLIYGGVYLFRRYVPSARNMFGGGALKVIGRTYLGPKCYILLVKVGSRLVMVGVTGSQMSPLTEITDAGEITAITNEMAASAGPFGGSFGKSLRRRRDEIAANEFDRPVEMPDAGDVELRGMRDQLEDITQKMNWWRKTAGS